MVGCCVTGEERGGLGWVALGGLGDVRVRGKGCE